MPLSPLCCPPMRTIRVQTPATTANLGSGFDTLGLALGLYNTLTVEPAEAGVEVYVSGEGADRLPKNGRNTVVRAMRRLFGRMGRALPPLRLRQENAIPLGRGLGSSSAAIVGGLMAANAWAGEPFTREQLLHLASALDGHPDNVAACLFGGLVVTALEGEETFYARLPVCHPLQVVLYIPVFETRTPLARQDLPECYSRRDAVFNVSRAALTTAAFATGRWDLLRVSMQDRMHQPYRLQRHAHLPRLVEAALAAGARGAALSGSGPTIAAFTDADPAPLARALEECAAAGGLPGRVLCVPVDHHGAQVTVE
ncbi:MAG: homoserine kinase [Armatimonadota bacterium]|nr:homoserine kinase [Armatimonadota bacterium]